MSPLCSEVCSSVHQSSFQLKCTQGKTHQREDHIRLLLYRSEASVHFSIAPLLCQTLGLGIWDRLFTGCSELKGEVESEYTRQESKGTDTPIDAPFHVHE